MKPAREKGTTTLQRMRCAEDLIQTLSPPSLVFDSSRDDVGSSLLVRIERVDRSARLSFLAAALTFAGGLAAGGVAAADGLMAGLLDVDLFEVLGGDVASDAVVADVADSCLVAVVREERLVNLEKARVRAWQHADRHQCRRFPVRAVSRHL